MTPLVRHQNIYFKREDQNPTGSAKDRAISVQVDNLIASGYTSAVISSTGNAAISADYYCHLNHIPLTVFVSPKVNPHKLLLVTHSKVVTTDQPISSAFKESKLGHCYLLRQSTDPTAQVGYAKIAQEIIDELPEISSIFIPVGSGTTLFGISQKLPENVKIFAVQPASHCPISSLFDKQYTVENDSITDSLSAKLLPLKQQVIAAITQSGGSGIVVQNSDVIANLAILKDSDISTSAEGALALSGYQKAKATHDIGACPVILLTGTFR